MLSQSRSPWDWCPPALAATSQPSRFVAINTDNIDLKQQLMVCLPAGVNCDIISGELRKNREII
ncbi:hypothetical protein TSAR_005915 [Trichomalopsis sarcophagae]|uniref:Uncharacterized protein n=1 Tax=Trichomalopsis sarcophagae TaxID=543379 RepID=A0A232ERK2_9HYME|nr:hypothetical protein TSAR_005915 [Trichomalopsis sarcophagae]